MTREDGAGGVGWKRFSIYSCCNSQLFFSATRFSTLVAIAIRLHARGRTVHARVDRVSSLVVIVIRLDARGIPVHVCMVASGGDALRFLCRN